jgi:hypothetical protein
MCIKKKDYETNIGGQGPVRAVELLEKKWGKAIPVTVHGGTWGCETSRIPHFLDSLLTDGGKVFSLMCWPPFTAKKIPGIHFC